MSCYSVRFSWFENIKCGVYCHLAQIVVTDFTRQAEKNRSYDKVFRDIRIKDLFFVGFDVEIIAIFITFHV